MTYLLTLLVISRGYLSSILRSISLFYNLRLSRIFFIFLRLAFVSLRMSFS